MIQGKTLRKVDPDIFNNNIHSNGVRNNENNADIVCFSHLRWNFVFQRPQHLLTHASKTHKIYFIEEPIFESLNNNSYTHVSCVNNVTVITPYLPKKRKYLCNNLLLDSLIAFQLRCLGAKKYIAWYYTPMAIEFTRNLEPHLVIYDCMDELSGFAGVPPGLKDYEVELLSKADIVFTGGRSIYESKKDRNPNVYIFPSSIDANHYSIIHKPYLEPSDQKEIGYPKIGYFGVIDERLDIELLDNIARLKPEMNFIMIGPVVKTSPDSLPKRKNIYYLGQKDYKNLPQYIHSWDAAMMPFALNASTKFISPTKVLEYLAAGKQVISTAITDVINPYGKNKTVEIANGPEEFVNAIGKVLISKNHTSWRKQAKKILSSTSWTNTWEQMNSIITKALNEKYSDTKKRKRSITYV
jgi:UDP-galactopyranose mutase